jgi:hypothetical protein
MTIRRLKDLKIERLIGNLVICNLLIVSFSYGIWGIGQDITTRGAGNFGYTGFLTLPLYLTTPARDSAILTGADEKFRTYGGYIQYGITDKLDVGLQGNSSINSSIGFNVKYRPTQYLATLVGLDYEMNELLLAPFGVLMGGKELSKYFSVYGGVKAFNWSKMKVQTNPESKKNVFGTVLFAGMHIYRKQGWGDNSIMSSMPTGLYVELGYPVSVDSKCITITLGLDGFLGLSLPGLQWH